MRGAFGKCRTAPCTSYADVYLSLSMMTFLPDQGFYPKLGIFFGFLVPVLEKKVFFSENIENLPVLWVAYNSGFPDIKTD